MESDSLLRASLKWPLVELQLLILERWLHLSALTAAALFMAANISQ